MDTTSILEGRMRSFEAELTFARERLEAEHGQGDLRGTVIDVLLGRIGKVDDALEKVRTALRGHNVAAAWQELQNVQGSTRSLLRETLAVLEGAAARRSGVDDGLCRIADHLLAGLSGRLVEHPETWKGFTMLADGESYADIAWIIRLRFPEASIWNLPVAAHELGHFVIHRVEGMRRAFETCLTTFSETLVASPPEARGATDEAGAEQQAALDEKRRLEREDLDKKRQRYLHEYFADAFAVYTTGPAYARSCLLLRFDPIDAFQDGAAHPADARRAHVILKVLELMGQYSGLAKILRAQWEGMVAVSPHGGSLTPGTVRGLDSLGSTLHERLHGELGAMRYGGWSQAANISMSLDQGAIPDAPADDIRDVLNAAWRCRLDPGKSDVETVGANAKAWCQAIVDHAPARNR